MSLKKKDIVEESLAQIEIVRGGGGNISHLDSHGHLHKFPSFLLALPQIMKRGRIERMRRVQSIFLQQPSLSPTSILNRCFDWWIAHSCKTTDYFYMSANNMDTGWADLVIEKMDKLPKDSIIEIGVHPGHANSEKERWRIAEYNDIKEFAEKVRGSGKHQVISWKDV